MRDDTGHAPSPILEGEPPRQPDEVHENHREYAQGDVDFYPPVPVEGPAPNTLPQHNLAAQPIFLSTEGPPLAAEERRKIDLIEERLIAVEGFGDYPFADMADLCLVSQPTHWRERNAGLAGASSKKGIRAESPPTFI